jgi:hypothetical protein
MREDKDSILMQIDKSLLGIEKVQSYLRKPEVITQYTLPYHFNMNSVDERSSKLVKTLLDVCYWELTFLNLKKERVQRQARLSRNNLLEPVCHWACQRVIQLLVKLILD